MVDERFDVPSVRQCQKGQKGVQGAFGTFVTPSVSECGKISPVHSSFLRNHLGVWQRRGECPGAAPVLVSYDEIIVECDVAQEADAKA